MPKFYRGIAVTMQATLYISVILSPAVLFAFNINVKTLGI